MTSLRATAELRGIATYYGKMCEIDGCRARNTKTGNCMECEAYLRAIAAKRIVGTAGDKIAEKLPVPEWWVKKQAKMKKEATRKAIVRFRAERGMAPIKTIKKKYRCSECNGMGITGSSENKTLRECKGCHGRGSILKEVNSDVVSP